MSILNVEQSDGYCKVFAFVVQSGHSFIQFADTLRETRVSVISPLMMRLAGLFVPSATPSDTGIERTVTWYRDRRREKSVAGNRANVESC